MLSKANFKLFWRDHIKTAIGPKTGLVVIMLALTAILMLLNLETYQYHGVSYLSWMLVKMSPAMLLFFLASRYIRKECPRIAFFLGAIWTIFVMTLVVELLTMAIQLTPFSLHDVFFRQLDQDIGFNLLTVFNWSYAHPPVYALFAHFYMFLPYELLLTPIVLGLLYERRSLDVFYLTLLISTLLGFVIYYFFPTSNPAGALQDSHFQTSMYKAVNRFYAIHHYLPVKGVAGGLIGFPSFHVIWSVSVGYAFRRRKYLFYPMIFVTTMIVLSTLMTGWHFLVDVFGGLTVVAVSIYLAEKLSQEPIKSETLTFRMIVNKLKNLLPLPKKMNVPSKLLSFLNRSYFLSL